MMISNQPLVSVLMNCYNGEKYLKEALDSILSQCYKNYEIIFIDNCSTDQSSEIAQLYPVKYFKTSTNISLGAARNFGLSKCSGEYVAFLDADDIWLDNILEVLVKAISSQNYALAYAGQIFIDSEGKEIKKYLPKLKQGNLFEGLLYNFDLPIIGSLINYKCLNDLQLNFDLNIHASEEYCLFMQLAAKAEFISLDIPLVKYRVHNNSLTSKTISKWSEERRYTLDKIIKDNENFLEKYNKSFKEAYARAAYYEAQYHMSKDDNKRARKALINHIMTNWKYTCVYVMTFFPMSFWRMVQIKKYGRGSN